MLERPKSGERAILVHITFPHGVDRADLREFTELAIAAGAYPVATVTGVRDVPDAKYFIGSGKIDELFHLIQGEKADVVLFNHELSPAQERNVEKKIQCRVLSRTGLILDIFAQRARTFEGKLQVELAQLEHLSTRLVRGWTHLERQKGGIGLRGPGETQLETDRRLIRVRIKRIQDKLEKVAKQRHLSRRKRQREAIPTVALVGYTNAGKSTLFNWLTGSDAFVANQLFATLDPTIRTLQLPQIGNIVLVDTVGFIRQLPHQLVNAFRATLEETRQADLLLHVVDAHDEASTANMEHVNVVLREIGADEVPQLIVYNKVDLQKDSAKKLNTHEKDVHGNIIKVWISALKEVGSEVMGEALLNRLCGVMVRGTLPLSVEQGLLRAQLYELDAVLKETVNPEGGCILEIQLSKMQWDRLCRQHSEVGQQIVIVKAVEF